MATMPPRVHVAALAGSGANRRPDCASAAFERGAGDARLGGHRVRRHLEDAAGVYAQIEDDGRTEALAGQPGAGPAGDQRQVVLVAVPDEHRDVAGVLGNGDRQRRDLERAGVGGIEPAREGIEAQTAAEQAAQVVGELLGVEHEE